MCGFAEDNLAITKFSDVSGRMSVDLIGRRKCHTVVVSSEKCVELHNGGSIVREHQGLL